MFKNFTMTILMSGNFTLQLFSYTLLRELLTTGFFVIVGRVAEFDTPAQLLEDRSSMFFKLVTEYSTRSSGIPDF